MNNSMQDINFSDINFLGISFLRDEKIGQKYSMRSMGNMVRNLRETLSLTMETIK